MSRRLVLDDGRNQRELVVRERMTVGRDPGCDITDGDPRLSRRHAEFQATASGLVVRDLESRNGVRVNGRAVREATLAAGDLVEIAHLRVRFLDDSPAEPAGVALAPPINDASVDGVQVREGFEDDRTRVLAVAKMSAVPSGPIVVTREVAAVLRDAGDVAISAMEGTVRVARPDGIPRTRGAAPKPQLGVQGLMTTGWGWRVLAQGVLLAAIVFLMVTIPMLNWLTSVKQIGPGLLLKMLTAPLLASLFVGMIVASLIARTTARGLERDDHA